MSDGRRFLATCLAALWLMAFCYAFVAFWTTAPEGEGFVRGLNKPLVYLGWQGIAGMLALALWGVGRGWPKGAPARRLTAVPLGLALVHAVGIVVIMVWAGYG